MSFVKVIGSHPEFTGLLTSSPPDKLIVVDFTAVWCGPCQVMKPIFEEMSKKYKHVVFAQVDVDANQETSKVAGVSAMPTFQFYKASKKIGEMKGANPGGLEQLVKQYQGPVDEDSLNSSLSGHSDLAQFILTSQIEGLNVASGAGVATIFKSPLPAGAVVRSDCDEQLLLMIPFNQPVKLHSIKIKVTPGKGPVSVKTFVNLPNMPTFEEAESTGGVETLLVPASAAGPSTTHLLPLRFVKYQAVHSLILFICGDADVNGGVVEVEGVTLYGSPAEASKGTLNTKPDA